MRQVIILNGPAGVGKTTVGKLLAQRAENGVCISGDALKNFVVRRTGSVKGRLGYRNGATLIRNFIEAGYELVVFEYVFPGKEQINYFYQELEVDVPLFFCTLWASLATVRERESGREERVSIGEQVTRCYEQLASNIDELGPVIQTDGLGIEEVVRNVMRLAKQGASGR